MQIDIKTCLRKTPDKIVAGKVRGKEASDLLNVMSQVQGSFGTCESTIKLVKLEIEN